MAHPSTLRRIIKAIDGAIRGLGATPRAAQVEALGTLIDRSMGGSARSFHRHDHILSASEGADPIATLAAVFHDVVYVQVDRGVPEPLLAIVGRFVELGDGPYIVRRPDTKIGEMVLGVFGLEPGDAPGPYQGLNEWLSAVVAADTLRQVLTPRHLVEVVACIEATIPFRDAPFGRLAERLARCDAEFGLGLDATGLKAAVERAVWMANRDVENFAEPDVGRFLDNTWRLLPETNPALRVAAHYSIREYRTALHNMEQFLSNLPADRVFHRFGDVPSPDRYARLREATARNLDVARRYLRAKLCAIAVIEALASVTGGDAHLSLFMGDLPRLVEAPVRLEQFLPARPEAADVDPTLRELLAIGRSGASTFDLERAPLAAWLYAGLGESRVLELSERARAMFGGQLVSLDFLAFVPRDVVVAVAEAAAKVAFTREAELLAFAGSYRG